LGRLPDKMVSSAILFAGQGAQYIGMGKDLYDAFPESKAVFDKADKVLGFSLSGLCFEGPQAELTKTENCQPAILTTSIAAWEAFKAAANFKPPVVTYAAGLSLGEYAALVAASAIGFEDAVFLVRKRGEFMEEEAARLPGRMASVIDLDLAVIQDICAKAKVEIANINCPGQIVISGGIKEIEEASRLAEERGAKKVIVLEVSGAFHSSFMQQACLKLSGELSNVTAKAATQPQEIKDNLIKQVSGSVLWEDSVRFMLSKGVTRYFEFGPGKVLKGLMRRIDETALVTNIEKKQDIDNLAGNAQGGVQ
jgi:[acyl-carrier-protein] S-malonyltransferase